MKLIFNLIIIAILLIKNTSAMNDQHIHPSNKRDRPTRLYLDAPHDKSHQQRTQNPFAQGNECHNDVENNIVPRYDFNLILSSGKQLQTVINENFDNQNDFHSPHSFDNLNFIVDDQSEFINQTTFNNLNIFGELSYNEKSSESNVWEYLKVEENAGSIFRPVPEQTNFGSKEESAGVLTNKKNSYEDINSRNDRRFNTQQICFEEKNNCSKNLDKKMPRQYNLRKKQPENNGEIATRLKNKNKFNDNLDFNIPCLKDGSNNEASSSYRNSSGDEDYVPDGASKRVPLKTKKNKRVRKTVEKNELAECRNNFKAKNNVNSGLFEIKSYDNPEGSLEFSNAFANRIIMEREFNFNKINLRGKQLNLPLIKRSKGKKGERVEKKQIISAKRNSPLFLSAKASLTLGKIVLEEIRKGNAYTYAIKEGALTFEFFLGIKKHSENANSLQTTFTSKRNRPHILKVCKNSSKIFLKSNYILGPQNGSILKNKLVFERQVIAGYYHYLNTEIIIFIDLVVFGVNNTEIRKDPEAEKEEVSYLNKYSFVLKLRIGTKKCVDKEIEEKVNKIYGKAEVEEIERNLKYYEVVEFDMNLI